MFRRITKDPYFRAGTVLTVSGILIVLISAWLSKTNIGDVIAEINHTLTPVYIGIVLSFLLCPVYNRLVKWAYGIQKDEKGFVWDGREPLIGIGMRLKRASDTKLPSDRRALKRAKSFASMCCLLIVFGCIAIMGYILIPQLADSIGGLVQTLPERTDAFAAWADVHLAKFPSVVSLIHKVTNAGTSEAIAWIQEHVLKEDFVGLAEVISNSVMSLVKVVINTFIGILIAIYLLNYKEVLFAISRKIITAICSEKRSKAIYEFGGIINETFISFIVGRLMDAGIIWILTYLVLTVFRMPMPLLISAIVGITNVIPFFGPFIGAVPSVIIILLENPIQALEFIVIIVIIQQIDGNFIGPKIVGNAIGINSFWVLIAVLVGGGLFGFLGMAIGVPVFAVIYRYINKITESKLRKKDKKTRTSDYLNLDKYDIDAKEIDHEEN